MLVVGLPMFDQIVVSHCVRRKTNCAMELQTYDALVNDKNLLRYNTFICM